MSKKILNLETKEYDVDEVRNIVDLDSKVEHFLSWYKKNVDKDIKSLENIIEKVASWYEMRYPDFSLDPNYDMENSENCNKNCWSDLLDYDRFYSLLNWKEQSLLRKPFFPSIIDITPNRSQHFHVDPDGTISDASNIIIDIPTDDNGMDTCIASGIKHGRLTNGEALFQEHNLREVEDIVKENKVKNFNIGNIKQIVDSVDREISIYNGLLDAITCRIIDRGGEYFGPKRGMLFAKEFGRPLDLGIQYGSTYYDLVCDYLGNGGSEDTLCYFGYFDKYNNVVCSERLSQMFTNNQVKDFYGKPKIYSKNIGNNQK